VSKCPRRRKPVAPCESCSVSADSNDLTTDAKPGGNRMLTVATGTISQTRVGNCAYGIVNVKECGM
jgi:hypothetical protein